MSRTVREALDAPRRMAELQKKFWDDMQDAKLSIAECVSLLEGIKAELSRRW